MTEAPTDFTNVLASLEDGENADGQHQPLHEYDVYVQADEGRITFIKKPPQRSDEEPHPGPRKNSYLSYLVYVTLLFFSLLQISSAATGTLPTITVTIIPKTQRIKTTQVIQLPARVLAPLTLTQSKATLATGKGHQNATYAHGTITFYNGSFSAQTIPAGTILIGADGTQIITDQLAIVPAAAQTIPPSYGKITVLAHASNVGPQGNIQEGDINTACCLSSILAQNTNPFHGGQDARDFKVVTQNDIDGVSASLKDVLYKSLQAAFSAQLLPTEGLLTPSCNLTIQPDHKAGDEAIQVQVTVSETCSGSAYEKGSLQEQATQVLTSQARKQLGAGYSVAGDVTLTINRTTVQNSEARLSITCSGVWVYQFSQAQQQHLLHLIAGKSKAQAIQELLAVSGIQAVSIDAATIPTEPSRIRLLILSRSS